VVDLAIPLSIDHPSCLTFRGTTTGARETTPFVAVLDGLDVPEVPGEAVEL
jgi:hypothetical protein